MFLSSGLQCFSRWFLLFQCVISLLLCSKTSCGCNVFSHKWMYLQYNILSWRIGEATLLFFMPLFWKWQPTIDGELERVRGDDMQERAAVYNRTWAAAVRTLALVHGELPGTPKRHCFDCCQSPTCWFIRWTVGYIFIFRAI